MKRGSITVFLALLLSVLTMVTGVFLLSVKLSAARGQIVDALDIGLYSLFAQYDRDLLEEFDLFFLDGAFDTGELRLDAVYNIVKEYMEPVLEQNFTDLTVKAGGLTGYSLATDHEGEAFCQQAVQAEREIMAGQGRRLSLLEARDWAKQIRQQEEQQSGWDLAETFLAYDQQAASGEETASAAKNSVEAVRRMARKELPELLLESPMSISRGVVPASALLSHREWEKGLFSFADGELREEEELLLQEYLLDKCDNYMTPGPGGLSYQWEYLLGGSCSDRENLEYVLRRLLRIREGQNRRYLYGDHEKRAEAAALAATFDGAADLEALEEILLDCWAFGESVLEVRALLQGGRIVVVKNAGNWRLPLERLPFLPGELHDLSGTWEQGVEYRDYLRALLFMEEKEEKVRRGMDMVESAIRAKPGRETFRLDACIAGVEAAVDVEAGGVKTFTATQRYSYGDRMS